MTPHQTPRQTPRQTPDTAEAASVAGERLLRHQVKAVPVTLDQFVQRLGGWGVLFGMYMALGGRVEGLPPVVQKFLADELDAEKAALASHQRGTAEGGSQV